jgi:hypothetical protein
VCIVSVVSCQKTEECDSTWTAKNGQGTGGASHSAIAARDLNHRSVSAGTACACSVEPLARIPSHNKPLTNNLHSSHLYLYLPSRRSMLSRSTPVTFSPIGPPSRLSTVVMSKCPPNRTQKPVRRKQKRLTMLRVHYWCSVIGFGPAFGELLSARMARVPERGAAARSVCNDATA